ncbi:MAG: hypothetical protein GXO10_07530, partial [Crenarchaeota archaeon]|nr:hypothetical protein [Thermoproteota archaeon]
MSSEVPRWLEDAVRKCKEGDERACRFVDVFLSKYFDARERSLSHIIGLLTGSGIATVVTSIRIVSIYLGIAIMILLITLLLL